MAIPRAAWREWAKPKSRTTDLWKKNAGPFSGGLRNNAMTARHSKATATVARQPELACEFECLGCADLCLVVAAQSDKVCRRVGDTRCDCVWKDPRATGGEKLREICSAVSEAPASNSISAMLSRTHAAKDQHGGLSRLEGTNKETSAHEQNRRRWSGPTQFLDTSASSRRSPVVRADFKASINRR